MRCVFISRDLRVVCYALFSLFTVLFYFAIDSFVGLFLILYCACILFRAMYLLCVYYSFCTVCVVYFASCICLNLSIVNAGFGQGSLNRMYLL